MWGRSLQSKATADSCSFAPMNHNIKYWQETYGNYAFPTNRRPQTCYRYPVADTLRILFFSDVDVLNS